MTTEELIHGYFDKTLTPGEQQELQGILAASPEARAAFETHGRIDELMVSEASTLAPSSSLDERVVLASLAIGPELIGGGAGLLAGSKLVIGLGTLLVAGVSIIVIATSSNAPDAKTVASPTPVVRTLPTAPQVAPPVVAPSDVAPSQSSPSVAMPDASVNEGTSAPRERVATSSATTNDAKSAKDRSGRQQVITNKTAEGKGKPALSLPRSGGTKLPPESAKVVPPSPHK
jgi:anti-sigma factor RsiW